MAVITPSSIRVDLSQVQFRSVANQSLINRLAAINNYITQNIALDSPVGTIIHSFLNQTQIQAIRGIGWVLCDGRNVAGSAYATLTGNASIPDARGRYLRGKNNGRSDGNQNPDGELALGTFQADQIAGHDHEHTLSHNTSAGTGSGDTNNLPPFTVVHANGVVGRNLSYGVTGPTGIAAPHLGDINPVASTETRPVTITANAFIRIN